jgi:hypothetical protein
VVRSRYYAADGEGGAGVGGGAGGPPDEGTVLRFVETLGGAGAAASDAVLPCVLSVWRGRPASIPYAARGPRCAQDPPTYMCDVASVFLSPGMMIRGMQPLEEVEFVDAGVTCAYSDHWVSNVVDRRGFLDTLEDTLGFVPKVDFNAGVVAAVSDIITSPCIARQLSPLLPPSPPPPPNPHFGHEER